MSVWVQKEVDELPEFKNRSPHTTYKTPDGQVWVPNNLHLDGKPTHWMKLEDHLAEVERLIENNEY